MGGCDEDTGCVAERGLDIAQGLYMDRVGEFVWSEKSPPPELVAQLARRCLMLGAAFAAAVASEQTYTLTEDIPDQRKHGPLVEAMEGYMAACGGEPEPEGPEGDS